MDESQITLFRGIPTEVIDKLLNDSYNAHRTYTEDMYIATQGTPCRALYILTRGIVNATMTNIEGKELTIEQLSAPALLAPAFLFGNENRFPVNLTALTDCEVCIINKDSLLQFMHDYPSLMENFMAEISDRCVFLSRKVNEFALQNLRYRVINYLRKHGNITNQQETSSRLGVARPSLARVLSELQKEHIIKKTDNGIELTDSAHLKI